MHYHMVMHIRMPVIVSTFVLKTPSLRVYATLQDADAEEEDAEEDE